MTTETKRFLWPREHGAWGQMAMPLATGLALGRPGASAWLFALAAALAFLAHEPALVLLGSRGLRAEKDDGRLARRLLALLGGGAAAAGLAATALAPAAARLSLAVPAVLLLATLWLARRRLEMTTGGEVVIGSAMASALLPVALAAGATPRAALAALGIWALSFAMAAVAVAAVLARGKPGTPEAGPRNALLAVALLLLGVAVALAAGLPWLVPASLVPTALFGLAACLGRAGPDRLKQMGWGLVASTLLTLAGLVGALRGG